MPMTPREDQIDGIEETFAVLANPVRVAIVAVLLASKSGMRDHELAVALDKDVHLIKKYLGWIEEAGLVIRIHEKGSSSSDPIYQAEPFAEEIFSMFGLDSPEKLLKYFRKFIVNPPPDR